MVTGKTACLMHKCLSGIKYSVEDTKTWKMVYNLTLQEKKEEKIDITNKILREDHQLSIQMTANKDTSWKIFCKNGP